MNLQESIRRILREEDFIPLESLNIVIEDYEDGFDVFIMNGDKKIGEISFAKENLPNLYTIVAATIDDEYKGNRIYPKTIINLFKERPNIIINSLFRSPEANKAWIYLLSNLPPNIGKSVKYYKEEDTTLFQLKLKNLQESIRRILREEIELPLFIKRRFTKGDLDLLIYNIENTLNEYKNDKEAHSTISEEDVIDAEIYEFIANSIYHSEFVDFNDQRYEDSYNLYRNPLINYVKTKLNMI